MWNEPSSQELAALPGLYETDQLSAGRKPIGMHFFIGGCDWYVAEYSPEERVFFGYAILNGDRQCAEWGYIPFDELRDLKLRSIIEVDRDTFWDTTLAKDISKIQECYKAQGIEHLLLER